MDWYKIMCCALYLIIVSIFLFSNNEKKENFTFPNKPIIPTKEAKFVCQENPKKIRHYFCYHVDWTGPISNPCLGYKDEEMRKLDG